VDLLSLDPITGNLVVDIYPTFFDSQYDPEANCTVREFDIFMDQYVIL